jgi:hypothetical protein
MAIWNKDLWNKDLWKNDFGASSLELADWNKGL